MARSEAALPFQLACSRLTPGVRRARSKSLDLPRAVARELAFGAMVSVASGVTSHSQVASAVVMNENDAEEARVARANLRIRAFQEEVMLLQEEHVLLEAKLRPYQRRMKAIEHATELRLEYVEKEAALEELVSNED